MMFAKLTDSALAIKTELLLNFQEASIHMAVAMVLGSGFARLDIMQSYPMCRTRYDQYQSDELCEMGSCIESGQEPSFIQIVGRSSMQ